MPQRDDTLGLDRQLDEDRVGLDWPKLDKVQPPALKPLPMRYGVVALWLSPLARRIVLFNLIAMLLMVLTMIYVGSSREALVYQRGIALMAEAELISDVLKTRLALTDSAAIGAANLTDVTLRGGVTVSLFQTDGTLVSRAKSDVSADDLAELRRQVGRTVILDALGVIGDGLARLLAPAPQRSANADLDMIADDGFQAALQGRTHVATRQMGTTTVLIATTPIRQAGQPVGVITVATAAGEVEWLVRRAYEDKLWVFLVGFVVSMVLSFVLAANVARPIAALARAAEASQTQKARRASPVGVRIPDLTSRKDEIGRLSGALRAMVAALSERIESNEQFAADVAHEIKNPLASLRSAVGALRLAQRIDQRARLLDIIEHDVRRLDRLVSDISNASRLDSDLVRDVAEHFDLHKTLRQLVEYLRLDAEKRGIQFVVDIPPIPVMMNGLEARMAQVFVNLITNALSFTTAGDQIRVWSRVRRDHVLVVVEDSGPGIPEGALEKIFQRFYSERPAGDFGNNSGLGLAISKQIVAAHGGVIWAENIRPADASPDTPPQGARFVVGVPV